MAPPEPAPSFQYAEEEVPSYEWAEEGETYLEPPAAEPAASTVMPPEVPEPVAEASGAELGTDFSLPDDMPARQCTDAPTSGQSPSAPAAYAAPPPEQSPEESGDASNKKEGEVDDSALQQLDASDLEMARITGDLIDLLIGRDIINSTDFPGMAQRKLINRRALRSNM